MKEQIHDYVTYATYGTYVYIYVLYWVRDFMLTVALRMESQEKKCAYVHQE